MSVLLREKAYQKTITMLPSKYTRLKIKQKRNMLTYNLADTGVSLEKIHGSSIWSSALRELDYKTNRLDS
jgi:hypothetical protein